MQAWLGTKNDITVSMFQWSVLATARFAGFDVKPEYDDGFFSVDMAVFLPGTPPVKVSTAAASLLVCRWLYELPTAHGRRCAAVACGLVAWHA